ncbi:MAG TPA: hypothetical protein ENI19_00580 [Candidatus Nealsonbacteria bacterium]|nr:hypothetical protein [Candidatus Nealsonbacteria bacterium]HEB46187.1 hypothetical protein [Candidatus Nealsonbacteria bacterium]
MGQAVYVYRTTGTGSNPTCAPTRKERMAKYNRLLKIEEELKIQNSK